MGSNLIMILEAAVQNGKNKKKSDSARLLIAYVKTFGFSQKEASQNNCSDNGLTRQETAKNMTDSRQK
jgi:hypothetical protein